MTGGVSEKLLNHYLLIARDIKERLVFKTVRQELVGIGVAGKTALDPVMEHLATFAGGMFAIGSVKQNDRAIEDLELADQLARTYSTVYQESAGGVMPDRVRYNVDRPENPAEFWPESDEYLLRPESVESVYLMWRFTGLQKYRDYAWAMFQGINRTCRVEGGFSEVKKLDSATPTPKDVMESFFLAETLKYLYLTFSDSSWLQPGEWIFNTEAHPLLAWDAGTIERFRDLLDAD
jgi:mannosyl-oligosaccharide alpha-1,2-mannosidase